MNINSELITFQKRWIGKYRNIISKQAAKCKNHTNYNKLIEYLYDDIADAVMLLDSRYTERQIIAFLSRRLKWRINNYFKTESRHSEIDQIYNNTWKTGVYNQYRHDYHNYIFAQQLIDSLEKQTKQIFRLKLSGYKLKEIAESLNLNVGTVKSKYYYQIRLWRKQYRSEAIDGI